MDFSISIVFEIDLDHHLNPGSHCNVDQNQRYKKIIGTFLIKAPGWLVASITGTVGAIISHFLSSKSDL